MLCKTHYKNESDRYECYLRRCECVRGVIYLFATQFEFLHLINTKTFSPFSSLFLFWVPAPNAIDQMKTLCKTHFLQMVYRKADGAVLWSQNERNLDCALTFQTHSILQRFLVRFDTLQLDCNDHLYIYDGAHATGVPKVKTKCYTSHHINAE